VELKGYITLEEAMQITYLRYGRQQLDSVLEEVFGTSDLTSGKRITVTEFLHRLHRNQVKILLSKPSTRGPPSDQPGQQGAQTQ
jgi:calmodulin